MLRTTVGPTVRSDRLRPLPPSRRLHLRHINKALSDPLGREIRRLSRFDKFVDSMATGLATAQRLQLIASLVYHTPSFPPCTRLHHPWWRCPCQYVIAAIGCWCGVILPRPCDRHGARTTCEQTGQSDWVDTGWTQITAGHRHRMLTMTRSQTGRFIVWNYRCCPQLVSAAIYDWHLQRFQPRNFWKSNLHVQLTTELACSAAFLYFKTLCNSDNNINVMMHHRYAKSQSISATYSFQF